MSQVVYHEADGTLRVTVSYAEAGGNFCASAPQKHAPLVVQANNWAWETTRGRWMKICRTIHTRTKIQFMGTAMCGVEISRSIEDA